MHSPWVVLALVAVACSPTSPEPAPKAAPAAPSAPPSPAPTVAAAAAARMPDHFGDSIRIKDAVIAGELEDVRAPAQRLVDQVTPEHFPGEWRPHVEAVGRHAATALAATDIAGASAAAAGLAGSCGGCHAAVGRGPTLADAGTAPVVGPRDPPKTQMLRHQWAADRMWEALISRGDERWRQGAAALADAPLRIEEITADVELPEEVQKLGDRVHELGRRAQTVSGWDERATIYGEFIASCATCHKGGC